MRLLYGDSDNSWHDVKLALDVGDYETAHITHASFTPENEHDLGQSDNTQKALPRKSPDGALLLATYDTQHTLKVYRILVNWNIPQDAKSIPQKLDPVLSVSKVKQVDRAIPHNVDAMLPTNPVLSNLKVLGPIHDFMSRHRNPPVVMATFAAFEVPLTSGTTSNQIRSSIVCRWEVLEEQEQLHSCFSQLSSKKSIGQTSVSSVGGVLCLSCGFALMSADNHNLGAPS